MIQNEYWLLSAKKKGSALKPVIVELTPDGMVYIWPVVPAVKRQHVPAEADQDPDALAIDGDFIDKNGFFHGIYDFMSHSNYTAAVYDVCPIGERTSIRSCRSTLAKSGF